MGIKHNTLSARADDPGYDVSSGEWNENHVIDDTVNIGAYELQRTITAETLGVGVTTFAVSGEAMEITGDGGANVVASITGGVTGQILILTFVDGLVTITDTDAHTANTVDLSAGFVSADDTMLMLFFDGSSWYELSRSVN